MPYSNTAASSTAAAPEGLVAVDGRTFPLRSAEIKAKAQGGLAFTTLRQEFANPYAEPLEVLYTMPLPADGAVVGYTFRLGERVVRGQIETREQARGAYEKALLAGKTAGLLEQERADTFTQTLGNLPPGAAVAVEIEVLHPLAFLPGVGGSVSSWEWRFPTVVSVRYGGGDEVKTDRAHPGTEDGIPARVTAELIVGEGPWLVAQPQRMDRDLVFTWAATTAEVEAHVVEGPGLPGDDGRYAMIVVTPPTAPAAVIARDLTILLDASGSMQGLPLAQAKEVVRAVLGSLREADTFEVLAFSDEVTALAPPSRADRRAVDGAGRRLEELRAGGGTEMTRALQTVLAQAARAETQRQVVLISDGYVGFEEEIGRMVRERLPAASRLHVVGIGAAPNRALTRAAARAGRGLELLVGPEDDPGVAAARLLRGTVAPVLTEVSVSGSGYVGFAPERPRDVFAGEPLTVLVHVVPGGGELEVTGRLAGAAEPWTRRFAIGGRAVEDRAMMPLGAAYARERVEDMEAREHPDDGMIESLGLRHRIVTRRTSLVAISEEPTIDPRNPRRRMRLPVELPYGVSAEGVGLADGDALQPYLRSRLDVPTRSSGFRIASRARQPDEAAVDGTRGVRGRIADYFRGLWHREPWFPTGRVLFFDGGRLVLEFQSPEEGIELPGPDSGISVELDDGSIVEGKVNEKDSTPGGRHEAGLILRLVLQLDPAPPAGRKPARVVWALAGGGVGRVDLA